MKVLLLIISFITITADNPDPLRFKQEINEYKEADKINPPQQGLYLFIGSSSIRMWKTLEEDFAGYHVINRGFGGSHFSDAIYYFNDLVTPYRPKKIIIYEGDNDIASDKSPESVFKDFKKFLKMISKNMDNPEIAIIAAKPSPRRWHLKEKYESLNLKFEKFCERKENLTYIDVYKPMLNEKGRPDPQLFLKDSLHMNGKGYEIWKNLTLPFIEK
jgi:lysophospholipase L1-like esterase